MKTHRNVPFMLFVACLIAAVPLAWGGDGVSAYDLVEPLSPADDTDFGVKVTLCHHPPDNPTKAETIVVDQAAVESHLAHGDALGECPPVCAGVPSPVPKTGQTWCSDPGGSGNGIDCAGTGQDGEYQMGVSVVPRFTDNGDGTVKDNLTGLIWLRDAGCLGQGSWGSALQYANQLSAATADESCHLTDGSLPGAWRLPNVKELQSLIDYSNTLRGALPPGHPFLRVAGIYWSSSSYVGDRSLAWFVSLDSGFVHRDYQRRPFFGIWPVRGGQ